MSVTSNSNLWTPSKIPFNRTFPCQTNSLFSTLFKNVGLKNHHFSLRCFDIDNNFTSFVNRTSDINGKIIIKNNV